jgi:hypothetical protein
LVQFPALLRKKKKGKENKAQVYLCVAHSCNPSYLGGEDKRTEDQIGKNV